MSGTHNKNLIFYSFFPNDKLSSVCLQEIQKYKSLDNQFIKFCVHDPHDISKPPRFKMPDIVVKCAQRGLFPIVAVAGFQKPIFGTSALSWIKESVLKQDHGVHASNIDGMGTADNCCTVEQSMLSGNALFDTDYNIGFGDGKGEFNKQYANIIEACEHKIHTYQDSDDKRKASMEVKSRFEKLKSGRQLDIAQAMPSIPQLPQTQTRSGQMPIIPQRQY